MTKIFSFLMAALLIFLSGGFCVYAEEELEEIRQPAEADPTIDIREILEEDLPAGESTGVVDIEIDSSDQTEIEDIEAENNLRAQKEADLLRQELVEKDARLNIMPTQIDFWLGVLVFVFTAITFFNYFSGRSVVKELREDSDREIKNLKQQAEFELDKIKIALKNKLDSLSALTQKQRNDLQTSFDLKEGNFRDIAEANEIALKQLKEDTARISDFALHFSLGMSMFVGKKLESALYAFNNALSFADDNAQKFHCYFQKGNIYYRMAEKFIGKNQSKFEKNLLASIEEFKKVIGIKQDRNTFINSAKAYIGLKKWDEAISNLEKAKELSKGDEDDANDLIEKLLQDAKDGKSQSRIDV